MTDPRFIPPRDYVADILEITADRFESGELKWGQGDYAMIDLNGYERHCAIGGLATVAGEDWNAVNHLVTTAAAEAMKPYLLDPLSEYLRAQNSQLVPIGWPAENLVIVFNDTIAEDVSEVVEVMKQAAKDLRNQS